MPEIGFFGTRPSREQGACRSICAHELRRWFELAKARSLCLSQESHALRPAALSCREKKARSALDGTTFRGHLITMKILVAYDFSEASGEALEQARAEAKSLGATLGLCHVLPVVYDIEPFYSQFRQDATLDLGATEAEIRRAAEDKVQGLVGTEPVEVFIERGAPYAEIVRRAEAWGADLLVVGTHGRSGIARVLLGSIAERVVRHAHVSVLVARPIKKAGIVVAATDLSEASLPVVET